MFMDVALVTIGAGAREVSYIQVLMGESTESHGGWICSTWPWGESGQFQAGL